MRIPVLSLKASLVLLLALLGAASTRADTATFRAAADTSLFEPRPGNNLGAATLASGRTANLGLTRAVMRFNLTTNIPAGSKINSARLTVRVTKVPAGQVTSAFGLHKLLQDWGEGRKGGDTGATAAAGEATWVMRLAPSTPWGVPGGQSGTDYVSAASGTKSIAGVASYNFDSTAQMVADVQNWLDNAGGNFGWMMISGSEGSVRSAKRFASRENGATGPTLLIDYTPPAATTPPVITQQPQPQTVDTSAPATFTITATGTAPLAYQWLKEQSPVANATNATLTINSAKATDAGTYFCEVTNSAGKVTSQGALLTVNPPPAVAPAITQQPVSQTVDTGASVTFTVAATGTEPLSYQWLKGTFTLPGATFASLVLQNVTTNEAGNYSCVVTNSGGKVTSQEAALTVKPPVVVEPDPTPAFTGFELADGVLSLRFTARAGNNYEVQTVAAVPAALWTTLTNIPAKLQTAPVVVTDPVTGATRFYRLSVTPSR